MTKTLVGAHRGASAVAPENTAAALAAALAAGADLAEVDVRLSADGHCVLMHDADVDRTTDGRGPLSALTRAQLAALDAGSWFGPRFAGEPVPALDEVLVRFGEALLLNLELKTDGAPGPLCARTLDALARHDPDRRHLVTSFDAAAVAECRRLDPLRPAGLILGRGAPVDDLLTCGHSLLSLDHRLLDRDLLRRARAAGTRIHAWTVADPARQRELAAWGVAAILANDPAALASALNSNR